MCGIIGYIGNEVVDKELVRLLKNLEYRGYDSAGVAVMADDNIEATKSEGKICNLENILTHNKKANCGIAHTRWATHGQPNYKNTHPHLSQDNIWAIVHNGIIENYASIKKDLINKGYLFKSETDTEVVCNLLQEVEKNAPRANLACAKSDLKNSNHGTRCVPLHGAPEQAMHTLIDTCKLLKGSYAFACLNGKVPNTLFLAKNKSPLYIAKTKEEVIVASDPICFAEKASEYYCLNDNEFCYATKGQIIFLDINKNRIEKTTTSLNKFNLDFGKKHYPHFMLKEIEETPLVLKRIVNTDSDNDIFKIFNKDFLNKYSKIVLIGCGTAYHASMVGASYIEEFARIDAKAYIASEYRYKNPIIDKNTMCILVSQSGETADTLAVCELAKNSGATTIALTNVLYSSLAKMADIILPVCAGPEIAVASTKAYTAQITIFYMLAKHIQNVLHNKQKNYFKEISKLAEKIKLPNKEKINKVTNLINNCSYAFFIGRDKDYLTAEEASLKLKEISYINCTAHPAGELKHGFLALVQNGTPVFVIATNPTLLDKTLNGAHEAYSRGANIFFVTNLKVPKQKTSGFTKVVLQNFSPSLMPIVSVIFFQQLAYQTSISKNINPDQPRNLAKSVTVE